MFNPVHTNRTIQLRYSKMDITKDAAVDVPVADHKKWLIRACRKTWDARAIRLLLSVTVVEPDINLFDSTRGGETAFINACARNDTDVVKLLIKRFGSDIDINYQNQIRNTALMIACIRGDLDLVELLINFFGSRIDINRLGPDASTALTRA